MSRGVKDLREMVCQSRHSVTIDSKSVRTASEEQLDTTDGRASPISGRTKWLELPDLINECPVGYNRTHNSIDKEQRSILDVRLAYAESTTAFQHPLAYDNAKRHNNVDNQDFHKSSLQKSVPQHGDESAFWGSVSLEPGSVNPNAVSARMAAADRHNSFSSSRVVADRDEDFDEIMQYFCKDFISTWLEQVKRSICDLSDWCQDDDNFVKFAHSWLAQFSEQMRSKHIDLEFNILKDQLLSAFRGKPLSIGVLDSLLVVVLHEFCDGCFTGQRGAYLFLDYMDSLSSSQNLRANLLANVKCSRTCMKSQYYECILAIRSFSIVSIWSAILDWYRTGEGSIPTSKVYENGRSTVTSSAATRSKSARPKSARPKTARMQFDESQTLDYADLSRERTYQAIRLGYIDVIQFMLDTRRVSPDVRDSTNKTLVFSAAANSQPAVLRFLLQQTDCYLYVNVAADSGNTPLHAAANRGDVAVARELLKVRDIKVDAWNHLCENATPLHLAAMHGHTETVLLLLNSGANPSRTMGTKTANDIARDFEHDDIVQLFQPLITRSASVLQSVNATPRN